MTLRLTDDETAALRRQAERENRSMQDLAREAVRELIARRSRADLIEAAIDDTLERYADALERLGQ